MAAFLNHLAVERRVASSTQTQALCALLFLYSHVLERPLGRIKDFNWAQSRARVPVVLTRDEVERVLRELKGTPWLVAMLLYGSGLRLLECVQLRVKDVDRARGEIRVRDTNGGRPRVTVLPSALREPLGGHLEAVRRLHEEDLARGACVTLPGALAVKYPRAPREWVWQWVFPPRGCTSTEGRVSGGGITCTRASSSARCGRPSSGAGSASERVATPYAIRLRRTCWRGATISGRSRSCWVTKT